MARVPLSHCDAVVSGVCPFLRTNPSRFLCSCVRCSVRVQTCCFSSVSFPPRPLLQVASPMAPKRGAVVRWFDWTVGSSTKGCCILVEKVSPFSLREGVCMFNLLFLGRLASTTLTNSWPNSFKKVEAAKLLQWELFGEEWNGVLCLGEPFLLKLSPSPPCPSALLFFALLFLPPSPPPPALSH